MTGINHALVGAAIGAAIAEPLVVIPVAFASHFVMDALPHFGEPVEKRTKLSNTIWSIDTVLVVIFYVILAANACWIPLVGALAAMSPDFAWFYRFAVSEKFGRLPPKPTNRFNTFHVNIQRYERTWGIYVEILVLVVLVVLFWSVA